MGATRVSTVMLGLFCLSTGLGSDSLFSPSWAGEIWPVISGGAFFALIVWCLYCAAEPLGRQVWPTMFISSSRLLSRPRIEWRDPLIGRSVLVGVVGGALLFAWLGGVWRLFVIWQGDAPPFPLGYDLGAITGQRQALGAVLAQAMSVGMVFLHVVALVVSQYLVKRRAVVVGITLVVWTIVLGIGSTLAFFFHFGASVVMLLVLLRAGIVALVAANSVLALGWLARCTDLSAWYAQPAIMALVAVSSLAIYGVWAATGNAAIRRDEA